MPILKEDNVSIAGNLHTFHLSDKSTSYWNFVLAQGKSGKGVGYVTGVLVMTVKSVSSVLTNLNMEVKAP